MKHRTDREETFMPLQDKTLFNVLRQLFITEFGYDNKVIFAEAMIERLLDVIANFVKPTTMLRPGQLLWMAVVNDGQKHAHKYMKEIPQVPVVLDLITDEELQQLAEGDKYAIVRRHRLARLLEQAFAQGGVLAQSDLVGITLVNRGQVSDEVRRFQKENACILPYRGTVQDAGATLTHKVEAVRLFEAGFLETEICRRLPIIHDITAVENYIQTYKNVLKLLERQFTVPEIAGILAVDERLIHSYIDIVREHHPQVLDKHPSLQSETASKT